MIERAQNMQKMQANTYSYFTGLLASPFWRGWPQNYRGLPSRDHFVKVCISAKMYYHVTATC